MRRSPVALLLLFLAGGAGAQHRADLERKVVVERRRIVLDERIFFEHGRGQILPVSFPILNLLAEKLQQNPQIELVQVEGHTDTIGPDEVNDRLSALRARSVRAYLVGHGVKPQRLLAKGFGASWPIASNLTKPGREKNRRVELVIIQVLKRQVWRQRALTKDYAVVIRTSPGAIERGPKGTRGPLAANHAVYPGDLLETGAGGAIVRLPGIVLARLAPQSMLRIEALHGDPGGDGRSARLVLERGAVALRSYLAPDVNGARVEVEAGPLRVSFDKAELRVAKDGARVQVATFAGEVYARTGNLDVRVRPGRGVTARDGAVGEAVPLPAAPGGRSPMRGEVARADLAWSPVAGATRYLVEVAKDVDFLDVVALREVAEPRLALDLPAGSYYWQVRARDAQGHEGVGWPFFGFTVK